MGTIAEKLNKLQTTKQAIKEAIINKGVSVNDADTFASYADKINSITVGGSEGGDIFEPLGYSTPQYIQDGIDYAKQIKDDWNASITNRSNAFNGDIQLIYFPQVDTSNVTKMNSMFSNCSKLQIVPKLDISNATNIEYLFAYCTSLIEIDVTDWDFFNLKTLHNVFNSCENLQSLDLNHLDTSKITSLSATFRYCDSLSELNISNWNTSSVVDLTNTFGGCNSLIVLDLSNWDTSNVKSWSSTFDCQKLEQIIGKVSLKSFSAATMTYYTVFGFSNMPLYEITILDLGYHSNAKQFNSSRVIKWGVDNEKYPNARQSLIDSLIAYSFDRATAGYETCTLTLHATSKNLLTDDEIAAITAKGFTIA